MGREGKVVKADVEKITVQSGRGIPTAVLQRLAVLKDAAALLSAPSTPPVDMFLPSGSSIMTTRAGSVLSKRDLLPPDVSEIAALLNLNEYEYEEEDATPKQDVTLDVTALDGYNDDVRKCRRQLLEECRLLPADGDVNKQMLERLRSCVQKLCRCCYYGTSKARSIAEGSVVLISWLLSRKNLPILFHIRVLQSLAEMVWNSLLLKKAMISSQGIQVILRLLRAGQLQHPNLASWATYAILSSAIGSGDVIGYCQKLDGMQEAVGEMTFPYYWKDWPANFGVILQGVLYGPHSLVPVIEDFSFL